MQITLNEKQEQTWELLQNPNKMYILLDGGRSSGKSVVFCLYIIECALKYPGSLFLVTRLRYNHAKATILHQTLRPLLKKIPHKYWKENKADGYISFSNGSEIWIGGYDEKERMEKILGSEYNVIYMNEVSQLSYEAFELSISCLRKKTEGLTNKVYLDCNPPSPLHWVYRLFHQKLDPKTLQPLARPDLYTSLKVNPLDNLENLPDDYIETKLDVLSDKQRRRFRDGEYVKAEGTVYERFEERHIIQRSDIPIPESYSIGVDFGLHMAAVFVAWCGDHIYILDDCGTFNITSSAFNQSIQIMVGDIEYIAYCDPSGGERLQEIVNSAKANNSVEPGIDYINTKIERNEFHVCTDATGVLMEIYDYRRDEKEKIVKDNDHYMDAMRYGIFSHQATPLQIFI